MGYYSDPGEDYQRMINSGKSPVEAEKRIKELAQQGMYPQGVAYLFPEYAQAKGQPVTSLNTPTKQEYETTMRAQKLANMPKVNIQIPQQQMQGTQPTRQQQQTQYRYSNAVPQPMQQRMPTQQQPIQQGIQQYRDIYNPPAQRPVGGKFGMQSASAGSPELQEYQAYLEASKGAYGKELGRATESYQDYLEGAGLSTAGIGGELMGRTVSDITEPYLRQQALAGAQFATGEAQRRQQAEALKSQQGLEKERLAQQLYGTDIEAQLRRESLGTQSALERERLAQQLGISQAELQQRQQAMQLEDIYRSQSLEQEGQRYGTQLADISSQRVTEDIERKRSRREQQDQWNEFMNFMRYQGLNPQGSQLYGPGF